MKRNLVLYAIWLMSIASATCGTPEFLNEPGIIDVHAHIGTFRGFDLSLENLLRNMQENHVRYALISNIDGADVAGSTAGKDEISVNEETARVAKEHPELKPLAWTKPGISGASASNIEPFLRDGFVGIKFHPEFNHYAADDPAVLPYLRLCAKYHVPALFHCGNSPRSSAETIYRVAKQFPDVPFVLYHMGFGTTHDEAIEVARQAKERGDAILYLETAQVKGPAIVRALKIVGADRILFGTDATYYGRYHYPSYAPALAELKAAATPEDFQKVIHGNATELFHLK